MSRGIRNNNPLNIRRSDDRWEGAREEQKDKKFVQFQSMAHGYRAAWKILQSYYKHFRDRNKPFTVRNIVYRWAPPSDNNHTEAYIRHVLLLSSIGGQENLLPPVNVSSYHRLSRLLAAMTCVECGISPSQVDTEAISLGYKLAFPQNVEALEKWLLEEDEYGKWVPLIPA